MGRDGGRKKGTRSAGPLSNFWVRGGGRKRSALGEIGLFLLWRWDDSAPLCLWKPSQFSIWHGEKWAKARARLMECQRVSGNKILAEAWEGKPLYCFWGFSAGFRFPPVFFCLFSYRDFPKRPEALSRSQDAGWFVDVFSRQNHQLTFSSSFQSRKLTVGSFLI